MSRIFFLVNALAFAVYGCSSVEGSRPSRDVSDSMLADEAASVIEQVLMEQPPKFRPESVAFTSEYVAYGKGVVSKSSGIGVPIGNSGISVSSGSSKSKYLADRIYFNSPFTVSIVPKGKWFVILMYNGEGYRTAKIYTTNKVKAERFDDALHSLQKNYVMQHPK